MSSPDQEFINSLELLLEGSPEGQDTALRPILHKLEHFVDIGDIEQAETATRHLGTAVGGQSL